MGECPSLQRNPQSIDVRGPATTLISLGVKDHLEAAAHERENADHREGGNAPDA